MQHCRGGDACAWRSLFPLLKKQTADSASSAGNTRLAARGPEENVVGPTKILAAIAVVAVAIPAWAPGVAGADSSPAWHLDGIYDGVQVDRREVPSSSFDELRLSIFSSSDIQRLCDAVYPPALSTKLERHFKKQVLLRETPTERWTYEQVSVPVFSDRDYVMHVKLEQPASSGHCSVAFQTEDDAAHPPVPGFVRIPAIRGHWDIFPVAPGKLSVQYRIYSEPGGGVPAFLARGGQRSSAIEFMKIILGRADLPAPQARAAPAPTTP
jgi:hypothetical protein